MKKLPRPIDDVERRIIRLLQEDGRMSTTDLARRLAVSEPTVRKKLARILDEGIIKIRAIADPVDLGYQTSAFIGLVVERTMLNEVALKLCEYDFIDTIAISTGPYDITIKACFESVTDIYPFLFEELTKLDGIKDSDTTLILQDIKHQGLTGVVGISRDQSA
ncbi:MAG: hypothetical protein K0S56_74 [Microvirga sp.]|nr:hypothetical protein [Microvirga sp.]